MAATCAINAESTATLRLPSQRDAIELTIPVDKTYSYDESTSIIGKTSSDRSRIAVVVRRGDLTANTNIYSILLWRREEVRRGRRAPKVLIQMSSSSNYPAISALQWAQDNETLWFIGTDSNQIQQVYTIDSASGALRQMTTSQSGVLQFSHDKAGQRIVFTAARSPASIWNDRTKTEGLTVSPNDTVPNLLLGYRSGQQFVGRTDVFTDVDLFVQSPEGVRLLPLKRPLPRIVDGDGGALSMSPNGRYIVVATEVPLAEVPGSWGDYNDALVQTVLDQSIASRANGKGSDLSSHLQGYELVNSSTGEATVMVDAPNSFTYGFAKPPIWAPDSDSVILSGIFLPIEGVSENERAIRLKKPVTVEYTVGSAHLTTIGDKCIQALSWTTNTPSLTCSDKGDGFSQMVERYAARLNRTNTGKSTSMNDINAREASTPGVAAFNKQGQRWVEARHTWADPFVVSVREDFKSPPVIMWHDQHGDSVLLDLNPDLRSVALGRVENLTWEWTKGQVTEGGLYYPAGYQSGEHYPLVIQTHGWNPGRFMMDGPYHTGFAARALTSHGFFVLQANDINYELGHVAAGSAAREFERATAIYGSAIRLLAERGLIDPARVGVIGFSRTGPYVTWALTHSPTLFAAASVAEGTGGGYVSFLTRQGGEELGLYGAAPVGDGLQTWVKQAPAFNLKQVRTPLMINVLCSCYLLADWDWYEGLSMLNKPVDMLVLYSGNHVLQRPSERWATSQRNIEWFDFWLNGRESSEPSKQPQYDRWESLRHPQIEPSNSGRVPGS